MLETKSERPMGSQPIDRPARKNSSCPPCPPCPLLPAASEARCSRRKQTRPTAATPTKYVARRPQSTGAREAVGPAAIGAER
jgi:hypothetical protein